MRVGRCVPSGRQPGAARCSPRSGRGSFNHHRGRGRRTSGKAIVVDASAALSALLNAGPARRALAGEQLHAPHLIDPEVANGLRRRVAAEEVEAAAGWVTLDTMRRLGITRYPVFSILDRVWELRDDLSAYHASYVALAELLDCNLLTADARLGRAPGIRCPVTVVPGQPSPAPSG